MANFAESATCASLYQAGVSITHICPIRADRPFVGTIV